MIMSSTPYLDDYIRRCEYNKKFDLLNIGSAVVYCVVGIVCGCYILKPAPRQEINLNSLADNRCLPGVKYQTAEGNTEGFTQAAMTVVTSYADMMCHCENGRLPFRDQLSHYSDNGSLTAFDFQTNLASICAQRGTNTSLISIERTGLRIENGTVTMRATLEVRHVSEKEKPFTQKFRTVFVVVFPSEFKATAESQVRVYLKEAAVEKVQE